MVLDHPEILVSGERYLNKNGFLRSYSNPIALEGMDFESRQCYAGLGTLSQLPPEIRMDIWDHFSLHIDHDQDPQDKYFGRPPRKYLGFLRASKAINNEACDFVYRKTILEFWSCTPEKDNFWLYVSTNGGLFRYFWDLEDAMKKGYGSLPLSKFKKIVVNILPLEHAMSLASLTVAWLRNFHIAQLLGVKKHKAASIHFRLLDGQNASWSSENLVKAPDGTPLNTFMHHDVKQPNRPSIVFQPDFVLVMTPFMRLRQFQRAELTYSEPLEAREVAEKLEKLLTRPEPFGSFSRPDKDPLSDKAIQQEFQDVKWHMLLASRRWKGTLEERIRERKFFRCLRSFEGWEPDDNITRGYINARRVKAEEEKSLGAFSQLSMNIER